MATDVDFVNQYFGDSDSEAEFLGFDAVDLAEIDPRNVVPEFEIPNLDNDDDILADIRSGWSKKISDVELPEFTGEPGVNVNLRNDAPLSDFLNLFINDEDFALMATETNRYYSQIRLRNRENVKPNARYETSANEIKQFLGLTLNMGIVEKPSIRSYWSNDSLIETPIFHKTMSRDRYLNLLTFSHITDNEQAVPRGHDDYNPLFKVCSFKETLQRRFRTIYTPEQHIAIDEGMVPWKGRLSFRQYLPNKPDRFGIKLYQLSESKSGYICDFEVYTGKDFDPNPDSDEEDKQLGHSYNAVLGLLRNNNLLGKGYTVYTDNYYSSPTLFDKLRSEDTTAVGTVRLTRKEMPIALKRQDEKGRNHLQTEGESPCLEMD